jgi:flagellar L-ring protein precursor FlgH
VKEVLPNGNLVLEGTRDLKLNKETQQIVISGIVRRDDVRPDNTVLSENMAMAEIRSMGTGGVIADRQRRGILTRLVDFLF